MSEFLAGIATCSSWGIAAFFFRFWKETRDRLFGIFGAAFCMLAVQRFVLSTTGDEAGHVLIYGLRLAAFVLILYAIWDKNRQPG